MKLNLLFEAFRQKYYEPVKHVGNILVLKLSEPIKVDHLGKIHTTDVICYNTVTNRFSGGITEPNGDVKIPPAYAFILKWEPVKGSSKRGPAAFVEWLNSKGYFSKHQIKTGTAQFIPKIDIEDKADSQKKEEKEVKFKTYNDLPNIDLQKKIILKHAENSTANKIFMCQWDYKSESHRRTEKNTFVAKAVYEERSGFYPIENLEMNYYSWNITDKDFMESFKSKIVAKKIIDNKLFLWTAGEPGVFCGATFVIIGDRVKKVKIDSHTFNDKNNIDYIATGPKLDIEDLPAEKKPIDPEKINKSNRFAKVDTKDLPAEKKPIDPEKINKSNRFANLETDTDEEIQAFLQKREKEKQEQAQLDAMLQKSREQAAERKPKIKGRRKLEID